MERKEQSAAAFDTENPFPKNEQFSMEKNKINLQDKEKQQRQRDSHTVYVLLNYN